MKILIAALTTLVLLSACGQSGSDDEKAIRHNIDAYVDAFNQKDVEKFAPLWSVDAEYVDPESEEKILGREAIEEEFADDFSENPDIRLSLDIDSIEFPESDIAVEMGRAQVVDSSGEMSESRYRAIHVKEEGAWYLSSVSEVEQVEKPSQYEKLKDLEWLVGQWIDTDDYVAVNSSCQWIQNRNFLQCSFTVSYNNEPEMEGTQIIGWDPVDHVIRAWMYNSMGEYGSSVWKQLEADKWIVQASITYTDGKKGAVTHILNRINEDEFSWQSVGREIDGVILPNLEEVVVVRIKDHKEAQR